MKQIEAEPGMHIRQAAQRLASVAKTEDCFLIFNDICITADHRSTVDGLCDEYDRLCEIRQKEYRESPEGKMAETKRAAKVSGLQLKANALMAKLPQLNFKNPEGLILWLCDIEEARDHIGVNVDAKLIQQTFIEHGFEPNAYCGDGFEKGNPEIEKRWLIGQAIADVYVPMVRHFASTMNVKFTG